MPHSKGTMKLQQVGIPDLRPEEQFIINWLRSEFSGVDNHSLSAAGCTDIRWEAVFETALRWNIAPMLYRIIKNQTDIPNAPPVPDAVLKGMEAAYIKTYMVNQSNFSELTEIIKSLTAAGIRVILLKGAHLAPFVYQDMGMRWMADIDVLIRRADLRQTNDILIRMGYSYPYVNGTAVWDDFGKRKEVGDQAAVIDWYKAHHMHLNYFNPNGLQNLELHWGIARNASPFSIDTERLWKRAQIEDLRGTPVHVLSPEDLILHIALHDAYYHHLKLFGLRPCCDIAMVVSRFSTQIVWERLHDRAREWKIERFVYLMLRLSNELFGIDIPKDLLRSNGTKRCSDPVFLQAARRLLSKELDKPAFKGMNYPSEIHPFDPSQSLFEKIVFFLKRIPISREELASRYSIPSASKRIHIYRLARLSALIVSYSRVYIVYFWFRLKHGKNHRADYTLDLWLTSPESGQQKRMV